MNDKRLRFETLAMPHLDAAYNLARWLARDPILAEDIVQDAMLRAFRAFDGFRGDQVKPWLLAIVRNCHINALGQKRRHAATTLPEDMPDAGPTPESGVLAADHGRRLNTALAKLPEEFREVVVLRELEEMSYREIADIIGIPIGTVMSRLARGRALLRVQLAGEKA